MSEPRDSDAVPNRPTLRELEVLRAVIATRKTTTAALRLGISQPAVSRALAQLETRLGHPLFHRDGGRLAPTADALAFDREIEPIFAVLARLEHWPRADRATDALRIVAPSTLAHHFLPPLIAQFLANEADTSVQFEIGTTTDVVAGVADGRFDIGLTDSPAEHAGVRFEPFRRARAHAVLPASHALAERAVITPAHLAGVPFIALTRRFAMRAVFDRLFLESGVTPRIVVETSTSTAACQFVAAGVGVALLNPFPLSLRPEADIVFRPFAPAVTFETCFVVSALGSAAACARRFIEFVHAVQPMDAYSKPL